MSRRYHKVGSQTTKDAETGSLAFQDCHARKYGNLILSRGKCNAPSLGSKFKFVELFRQRK